jgi:glucose/arabinose dehydrogenase
MGQSTPSRSAAGSHRRILALAALGLMAPSPALADIPIRSTRVASGLMTPVFAGSPPGDASRLFILEQGNQGVASIKILNLNTGSLNSTPFLTISGLLTGGESGLLGLAFHPDYANNGKFYVNVTAAGGAGITRIMEFNRSAGNPDLADPTGNTILEFAQPQFNHNGGWVGFGPLDGLLYIASGDGGGANDSGPGHSEPGGNAQDLTDNLLGKMLRIDVNGDDFPADDTRDYRIPPTNPFAGAIEGDDEIWSYGLRNPWRASHDRLTGDLYIGDVGQESREEIDFQPGNSPGGENYGWRMREGFIQNPSHVGGPPPPGNVDPIHDYDRTVGTTVTGGYVYRGDENDALRGTYFFADVGPGRIWAFKYDGKNLNNFREYTGQIPTDVGTMEGIVSFGEDALGRLYVVDYGGEIFRLTPAFPGDANLDRTVNINDFSTLASNFNMAAGATWAQGDFTDDGAINITDFAVMAANWNQSGGADNASAIPETELPAALALTALLMWTIGPRVRATWRR